jgi:hypothetical protein
MMVAGLTSHVGNSSVEQEVCKILCPPKIREISSADFSDCAAFRSLHVVAFAYLSLNYNPNMKEKLKFRKITRKHGLAK